MRPVHSTKNVTRWSNLLQDGGTTNTVDLVHGVDSPTDYTKEVEIGSTVKAVFVEFNANFEGNVTGIIDWFVWKNVGGASSTPNPAAQGNNVLRRFVLHSGMEMPAGINNSQAVKRIFVVKIPPKLRRIGDGDKIQFVYRSTTGVGSVDLCGTAIYKWFS